MTLKKNLRFARFSFLLALLTFSPLLAAAAAEQPGGVATAPTSLTLVILHTNDMHAQLTPLHDGSGGFANIAACLKQERSGRKDVLTLSAGDMTVGTPVSTIYKGVPIFDILNLMGFDAAVFGNHEFDNGIEITRKYQETARFPILSATIFTNDALFARCADTSFTLNGIRVGVIGATTKEAIINEDLKVSAPHKIVEKHLKNLRRNTDVLVLLSHLGVEEDEKLASQLPGIDVIVGGHSHTVLKEPVRVGKTLIVQAGSKGQYVGRVELALDPQSRKILSSGARLIPIPVKGLQPDPEVEKRVKLWEDKVSEKVDVEIGRCEKTLGREKLSRFIEQVLKDKYKTDFAIQHSSGTRASLPAGPVHIREMYNAIPFDNTIDILQLTPEQAAKAGFHPENAPAKPLYTVATNSYTGKIMIREMKLDGTRVKHTNDDLRQVLIDAVREMKVVNFR